MRNVTMSGLVGLTSSRYRRCRPAVGFLSLFAALGLAQSAHAGSATASAAAPGSWDKGQAGSTGATLTIQTFAGINGFVGSQNTKTSATATVTTAAISPVTFVLKGMTFGPSVWNATDIAKAGLNAYTDLQSTYINAAGTNLATATGYYSFLVAPPNLQARASVDKTAPGNVRAGAEAEDPVPVPIGSYPYAATIGGMESYIIDSSGDTALEPTSLEVDPGQIATIEFFADDSNDSTYLTTESDPIWEFTITLNGTGSAPVLSASFEDDPTRISIPGGPTNSSQDQAYANTLLSDLLSDTADVSLIDAGSFGEILDINDPVTLFDGTYIDAISNPGAADPNDPGDVAFVYGVEAGVAVVPEPSTWALMLLGFAGLGFLGYRRTRRARSIAV